MKVLITFKSPPAGAAYWQARFFTPDLKTVVAEIPLQGFGYGAGVDISSSVVAMWWQAVQPDRVTKVAGGTIPKVEILNAAMYELDGSTGKLTRTYPTDITQVPEADQPDYPDLPVVPTPPPVYDTQPTGTVSQYPGLPAWLARILPTKPNVGPPLPVFLNITWPWYKVA